MILLQNLKEAVDIDSLSSGARDQLIVPLNIFKSPFLKLADIGIQAKNIEHFDILEVLNLSTCEATGTIYMGEEVPVSTPDIVELLLYNAGCSPSQY